MQEDPVIIDKIESLIHDFAGKLMRSETLNVFTVLNTRQEIQHTRIIAGLLKCKRVFKYFCDELKSDNRFVDWKEFDSPSVDLEVDIGIVRNDKDNPTGGRLDLIIQNQDNTKAVIIENKIDAQDQEKQLERYYNFAKQVYKDFVILYLTPSGRGASETSAPNDWRNKNYFPISYSLISSWLGRVLRDEYIVQEVKDVARQYEEYLSKKIVEDKNPELLQNVIDELNVKGGSAVTEAKCKLMKCFIKEAVSRAKVVLDLDGQTKIDLEKGFYEGKQRRCGSCQFLIEGRKSWKCDLSVQCCWDSCDYRNLYIGVAYLNSPRSDLIEKVNKVLRRCGLFSKENIWCPYQEFIPGAEHWRGDYIDVDRLANAIKRACDFCRELETEIERGDN